MYGQGPSSFIIQLRYLIRALHPPSSRKFVSYITGWLTLSNRQALVFWVISAVLLSKDLFIVNNPTYTFRRWHGCLLLWAIVFFAAHINTVIRSLLFKMEGPIFVLHVLGPLPFYFTCIHGSTCFFVRRLYSVFE